MTDAVYEFRNYTLHPGRRDTLIDLFERHFVESQEALGAHVRGTFRNLDDPDRFVWLRSFTDMEARAAALDAFYTGEIWRTHRSAANATMIDSDNVLQLQPVSGELPMGGHPELGAAGAGRLIVAHIFHLPVGSDEAFASFFADEIAPLLSNAGGAPLATFRTEHAPNSYPPLPIRDETVFVTLTRFATLEAHNAHLEALASTPRGSTPLAHCNSASSHQTKRCVSRPRPDQRCADGSPLPSRPSRGLRRCAANFCTRINKHEF